LDRAPKKWAIAANASIAEATGVCGVREDFEFQSWPFEIGVRYLTGGPDVGYILPAGPGPRPAAVRPLTAASDRAQKDNRAP
jgi:hypothetical protein